MFKTIAVASVTLALLFQQPIVQESELAAPGEGATQQVPRSEESSPPAMPPTDQVAPVAPAAEPVQIPPASPDAVRTNEPVDWNRPVAAFWLTESN